MADAQIKLYPTNEALFKINVTAGQIGPIGITPQLSVASTITGDPNTNASVTISGTAENPALSFVIPRGTPFDIAVEYPTVDDLVANTNSTPTSYTPTLFDLALIQSNVEDADNAKLYIFDGNQISGSGGWTFVSDLSGATGPMRGIRWKPDNGGTTSTLQWQNNDGSYDEINEKNLALTFSFAVEDQILKLNIENSDGLTGFVDLTTTAEFGDGIEASVTSVKFINNNNTETDFQELGVYASFNGTELTLTNPDTTTVQQELSLSFDWDDTSLGIKTPTDQNFTYQKLSPDIAFDTSNGVRISVVEPDAAENPIKISPDITFSTNNGVSISVVEPNSSQNLIKISPDINFRNEGNGLELSIVEPSQTPFYSKISPDIYLDGTSLAIVEPGVTPISSDYVNLKGDTGDVGVENTPLFSILDQDDEPGSGLVVGVLNEIKFVGSSGIEVTRTNQTFSINLVSVDGGDF